MNYILLSIKINQLKLKIDILELGELLIILKIGIKTDKFYTNSLFIKDVVSGCQGCHTKILDL